MTFGIQELSPETLIAAAAPAGLMKDTAEASGLLGRAYVDTSIFELEHNTIFRRSWFAIGYASDVPKPGDMRGITIAGWELLLLRTRNDEIRCFHNVCRHRGMKLVDQLENGWTVRCKYHCWTYNLDGELTGTPHIGGPGVHNASGIERAALSLKPVRCEVWRDLVFVDIDGTARPLGEHLRPIEKAFTEYNLDEVRPSPEVTAERELPYNWKIQVEGGIESYHLPWVHPQLELPPPGYHIESDDKGVFIGFKTPMSREEMLRRSAMTTMADTSAPPSFRVIEDRIAKGETPQFSITFLLPNVTIVLMPNYLVLGITRPVAADKSFARRKFYYIGESAEAPHLAGIRSDICEVWRNVLEQDIPFLSELQRLCHVRDAVGIRTRFSPYWEIGLHKFQQYVVRGWKQAAATSRHAD